MGAQEKRQKTSPCQTGSILIYLALFACSNKGDMTGPAEITSVMIEGPSLIAVGETTQMTAQPLDNGGNPISGSAITWQSLEPSVVGIDESGMVSGLSVGSSSITATADGVTGSRVLSVKIVSNGTVGGAVIDRLKQEFGITVPSPLIHAGSGRWLSTTYVGGRLYRIYAWPDGTMDVAQSRMAQFPAAVIEAAVVVVDYPDNDIERLINSGWSAAQDTINQAHANYAALLGLSQPIVRFDNTNLLATPEEIGDPKDRADIVALVESRGHSKSDFDLSLSVDLNPQDLTGGFAGIGGDFAYIGNFFSSETGTLAITPLNLRSTARALYHHEVGHIWGWEHDWTPGCSESGQCDTFITLPSLFGWTDVDGDGVVEILDETPYGIVN